jgi:hypothetical protein
MSNTRFLQVVIPCLALAFTTFALGGALDSNVLFVVGVGVGFVVAVAAARAAWADDIVTAGLIVLAHDTNDLGYARARAGRHDGHPPAAPCVLRPSVADDRDRRRSRPGAPRPRVPRVARDSRLLGAC